MTMDNSRNYILERMRSRRTTIEEFNFDILRAPPLNMFLSPYDIQQLRNIATSLKYSARPDIRYSEIDKICRQRGLVKFAAGTNRVVYRHPEFPDYLFKIATDNIGMGDNPAEFRNQNLLKPFVAKCYEISPCGTVAIVERVNPITSTEEFISVCDDIFELLDEFIIGKYVIADCGSKFFMNFGVRKDFGIVLLDYPYLYELDGNKLYCSSPKENSLTGKCDGVIDYDDGYNFLKCKKCGAIYKAKELEMKIASNEIIIERQGEIKMKAIIKGGTNNVDMVIDTSLPNRGFNTIKSTIPSGKKLSLKPKKELPVNEEKPITKSVNGVSTEVKKEARISKKNKEEAKVKFRESINDVSEELKKEARSPITFSGEVDEEAKAKMASLREIPSPVTVIENAVADIIENASKIDIGIIKNDVLKMALKSIVDILPETAEVYDILVNKAYDIFDALPDEEFEKVTSNDKISDMSYILYTVEEVVNGIPAVAANYDILVYKVHEMFDELSDEEFEKVTSNDKIVEITDRIIYQDITVHDFIRDGKDLNIRYSIGSYSMIDDEEVSRTVSMNITLSDVYTEENEDTSNAISDNNSYESITLYDGVIMNISEINPDEDEHSILVPIDADGNYVTTANRSIIAIETIDKKSLDSSMVVSKKWVEEAERELADNTEVEYTVVEEEEEENPESEEDTDNVEEPVGSAAMDEFLEKEEV